MNDPSRPSSPASPMTFDSLVPEEESSGVVVVAAYSNLLEAELAKGRLDAAGIPARLSDAHTVGIAWHLGQAVGGVKVRVLAEDEERAREVLHSAAVVEGFEEDPDDEEAPLPAPSLSREALAKRALVASVFGVMFLPPATLYSLWLLLRFSRGDEPVSSSAKRRALMALAIDVVVAVALWVLLSS